MQIGFLIHSSMKKKLNMTKLISIRLMRIGFDKSTLQNILILNKVQLTFYNSAANEQQNTNFIRNTYIKRNINRRLYHSNNRIGFDTNYHICCKINKHILKKGGGVKRSVGH